MSGQLNSELIWTNHKKSIFLTKRMTTFQINKEEGSYHLGDPEERSQDRSQ
jgi:hypothetical protein